RHHAPVDGRGLGEAGDEQSLESRSRGKQPPHQLDPAHLRHDHVRDHEVDHPLVLAAHLQRGDPVFRVKLLKNGKLDVRIRTTWATTTRSSQTGPAIDDGMGLVSLKEAGSSRPYQDGSQVLVDSLEPDLSTAESIGLFRLPPCT